MSVVRINERGRAPAPVPRGGAPLPRNPSPTGGERVLSCPPSPLLPTPPTIKAHRSKVQEGDRAFLTRGGGHNGLVSSLTVILYGCGSWVKDPVDTASPLRQWMLAPPRRHPAGSTECGAAGGSSSRRELPPAQNEALRQLLPALGPRCSVVPVARKLQVSQGVVQRAQDGVRGHSHRERPPILLPHEEAVVVKLIMYYAERGSPMPESMIRSAVTAFINEDLFAERRDLIHQTFTSGRPGRKWMKHFIKRHPAVLRAHGRSLQAARAAASNPENLARMFALLKQVREEKKIKCENLFNSDECGVNTKYVLSTTRKRYSGVSGTASQKLLPAVGINAQAVTFFRIVAANWTKLPPTYIVRGKEGNIKRRRMVPPDSSGAAPAASKGGETAGEDAATVEAPPPGDRTGTPQDWQYLNDVPPPNSLSMCRTPAGMDRDLRTEWCMYATEHVFKTLLPTENMVLILDRCIVHLSYDALEALARIRVEVLSYPPTRLISRSS